MSEIDLLRTQGEQFATGRATYFDARPKIREPLPRIYLEVGLEGLDRSILALVDTGGHYCVLPAKLVGKLDLDDQLTETELRTAHGLVRGGIFSHRLKFMAREGDDLDIEAMIFASPDWHGPPILGYVGVLDRIRFAVDPGENGFCFGALA